MITKSNYIKLVIILFLFTISFQSCSNDDDKLPSQNVFSKTKITGVAEKGPFTKGAKVELIGLTEELKPTSSVFYTTVTDDKGSFSFKNLKLPSKYALLKVTGNSFSEVSGKNLTSTLQVLTNLEENSIVNINMLTHLEKERVEHLMSKGKSFSESKKLAQKDILNAFNIKNDNLKQSETLSLKGSAELISLSVLLDVVNERISFWEKVSNDLAKDGILDSEEIIEKAYAHASKLNLKVIREYIENKLNDSGSATIPFFEDLIKKFIREQTPFTVNVKVVHPFCVGFSTGTITVETEKGTAPFTFKCIDASGAEIPFTKEAPNTVKGLSAGVYSITTIDSKGYQITEDVEVVDPTPVTIEVAVTNTTDGKDNGVIVVNASGGNPPYTYGVGSTTQIDKNRFENLSSGEYKIIIADSYGCTVTKDVSIEKGETPLNLNIEIKNQITCNGFNDGSIEITANGGTPPYTYQLNNGSNVTQNTFENLKAGTYNVTVTDKKGLKAINKIEVSEPSPINTTFNITKASAGKSNGSITITPSGGTAPYYYSISTGSQTSINNFQNLEAGTYNIVITDTNSCTYKTVATIEELKPIMATVISTYTSAADKNDGAVTINASGGLPPYEYKLTKTDGSFGVRSKDNVFKDLFAATYTVTVTDTKGSSTELTVEVKVAPPKPLVIDTQVTNTVKDKTDGRIIINASGGVPPYTYSLSGGTFTTNNIFTNLGGGTYEITVKDAENNTATRTEIITEMTPFNITASITNQVLCNGGNDGAIEVNITGGTSPFQFEVTNASGLLIINASSQDTIITLDSLYPGNFTIRATDATGYIVVSPSIVIEEPQAISTNIKVTNTSGGNNNGSITVTATGGSGTYQYTINDANGVVINTNPSAVNLSPGAYTVTVTDSNGCKYQTKEYIIK